MTLQILILLNPIYPQKLINKKLKPQIENTLNIKKGAIFKKIIKFTFLKRFAIIPFSF